jgi:uncharacterized membrane protein
MGSAFATMLDYIWKAAATWLVGFAPQFEVYFAVPAGIALGIGYPSAVFWGVFGNFMAVPVTLMFFSQIQRIQWLNNLIERRYTEKQQQRLNRYGAWFVVAATPIVGVWVVAVMARIAGMHQGTLLVSSFFSVLLYGIITALLLYGGIAFFTR